MPAIASLEDLQKLYDEIKEIKQKHPESCEEIAQLMRKNLHLGYKNFCRLFIGRWTPQELKSGKRNSDRKVEKNRTSDGKYDNILENLIKG